MGTFYQPASPTALSLSSLYYPCALLFLLSFEERLSPIHQTHIIVALCLLQLFRALVGVL